MRVTEMLKRQRRSVSESTSGTDLRVGPRADTWSPTKSPNPMRTKYVAFEDQFRGSNEAIQERLRGYVPIFAGRSDVLDIGCGRGEFLAALKAAGISGARRRRQRRDGGGRPRARAGGAARRRARASDVAARWIARRHHRHSGRRTPRSAVLDAAARYGMAQKLRPGAPLVLETINPACWLAFFSSYIRDLTHVRPVHPETLQYPAARERLRARRHPLQRAGARPMKMKTIDLPADVLGVDRPVGDCAGEHRARGQRQRCHSQQPDVHPSRLRRRRLRDSMERIDVAVIGAGVTGLASARALARARPLDRACSSAIRGPVSTPARTTAASSTPASTIRPAR